MSSQLYHRRDIIDTLRITGLKVSTFIGLYHWEQYVPQTLEFDLSIPIEASRCQNNIAQTLDYAEVCRCITEFVSQQSFVLLETAAEQVLKMLQSTFSLTHLSMTVTKLFAVKNAGSIKVTLDR